MIRTQIYIPEEQNRELRLLANAEGKKLSSLVREGIELVLQKRNKKRAKKFDPWKDFIGKGKGGPKDLSARIGYYLYDEPYKTKK
jgi:hypothetical protein